MKKDSTSVRILVDLYGNTYYIYENAKNEICKSEIFTHTPIEYEHTWLKYIERQQSRSHNAKSKG